MAEGNTVQLSIKPDAGGWCFSWGGTDRLFIPAAVAEGFARHILGQSLVTTTTDAGSTASVVAKSYEAGR